MSAAPDGVRIIPLEEKYIESYHRCLDAVARERKFIAFVEAPPLDAIREYVLANLAAGALHFVAVDGEEVVGWCDITRLKWEGFTHCGRLGMGVSKDYRRRGIGRKLMEAALRKAEEAGFERVELGVFISNAPAIKLYETLDFVVEGVLKKARKLDGAYDDVLLMARFIEAT
ncbi:MAG: GNAT family N-acetyltransferase [Chlorobi bacterium]|nr:GNAT family N-acetyltransferase [Chlorobiota bacterium]